MSSDDSFIENMQRRMQTLSDFQLNRARTESRNERLFDFALLSARVSGTPPEVDPEGLSSPMDCRCGFERSWSCLYKICSARSRRIRNFRGVKRQRRKWRGPDGRVSGMIMLVPMQEEKKVLQYQKILR